MSSRLIRASLAATIALLIGAPAAQAIPPTTEILEDEGVLALPDFNCGSFVLDEDMIDEEIRITTFYDEQGGVDRVQSHAAFRGVITNSATGETFLDHVTLNITSEDGLDTEVGIGFNLRRPGEGAIFQVVGRRIFDADHNLLHGTGPNDEGEDLEASICAALA